MKPSWFLHENWLIFYSFIATAGAYAGAALIAAGVLWLCEALATLAGVKF